MTDMSQAESATMDAALGSALAAARAYGGATLARWGGDHDPVNDAMEHRYKQALSAGPVFFCPHDPLHGAVAYWLAHRPGFRCVHCVNVVVAQTKGTTEDRTCDHCYRVCPERERTIEARSIIFKAFGGPDGRMIAPVVLSFGVCAPGEGCRATGRETP